jgi:hypothetical protein
VTGTSTLNAGGNAITLTDGANDFTGAVSLNAGGNADVENSSELILGASTVGGDLDVVAAGISQLEGENEGLTVTGTSSFDAGAEAIDLSNGSNDFTGVVSLNAGGDIIFVDVNELELIDSTAGGEFSVSSGDNLTIALLISGETMTLNSERGSIVNANGTEVNVQAASAIVHALQGNVGTEDSPITFDVPTDSTIEVSAAGGRIVNKKQATVISDIAGLDATGAGVSAAVGASVLSALEEIGFVDWASLDPDVRLVDCLEPCIKLPADQLEDEEFAALGESTQMLVIRTVDGVKLIPVIIQTTAQLTTR